jgi:hypothetical protein
LKAASISSSLTATPPLAFFGTLLPLGTLVKLTQVQISRLHTSTEDHGGARLATAARCPRLRCLVGMSATPEAECFVWQG